MHHDVRSITNSAIRQSIGFRRYAIRVQYHGAPFLGFTAHPEENCIVTNNKKKQQQIDLRGYVSVETRLRQALQQFNTIYGYENLQVSCRTDRGVHAIQNTFHVDLQNRHDINQPLSCQDILNGLNFHLRKQVPYWVMDNNNHDNQHDEEQDDDDDDDDEDDKNNAYLGPSIMTTRRRTKPSSSTTQLQRIKKSVHTRMGNNWIRYDPMNDIRVLNVQLAPSAMLNTYHNSYATTTTVVDPSSSASSSRQPQQHSPSPLHWIDWNARYSVTQRTYIYRILSSPNDPNYGCPFEWDRSWRLPYTLNLSAMRSAAQLLIGTHDFSSFRGKGCQRSSPIVTIYDIHIYSQPYEQIALWNMILPSSCTGSSTSIWNKKNDKEVGCTKMITIVIRANAFLYRQVRNMIGCLVDVGRGQLTSQNVYDILQSKDRSQSLSNMAPAHGLFLANVQHGDFDF